jgi:thymidylate kinase
MNSIIILEGPDGAGKTTLARHSSFSDHTYYHQGPFKTDPYEETIKKVNGATLPAIFDRLHLGERVYGPIYRNKDLLGTRKQFQLDEMLRHRGAALIVCLPPYADALRAWQKRSEEGKEMFAGEADFRRVYEAYKALRSLIPTFYYDYTITSPERLREQIDRSRNRSS